MRARERARLEARRSAQSVDSDGSLDDEEALEEACGEDRRGVDGCRPDQVRRQWRRASMGTDLAM